MSSKSILIILHYTVSKFAYCFETQCTGMCVCAMCRTRTLTCWYRGHGRAVQISHRHHHHHHSFTVNCDSCDQLGFSRNFHNEVISLHTSALDSGTRQPGSTLEIYLGAKRGILTLQIFWKEIFSGAQVSRFSAKSLKLLPPAVRF